MKITILNEQIRTWRKIHKSPENMDRVYHYGIYRGLIIARRILRNSAKSQKKAKR